MSPKDLVRPAVRGRLSAERGMALVVTLMMMLLMSSLLVGFTLIVMSDARFRGVDRTRNEAFYAAHAGLEKLTTDLGNLFATNFAPNAARLATLQTGAMQPALTGVTFTAADGTSGYRLGFTPDANGNPAATTRTIVSGPYQGLQGLITPYAIDITARTLKSGEVHLQRTMNTVSIPVFQFGTFSETDLSFFAGPDFNFGGRVHTNGNLFLASGATLTMSDRVTAVGEVIRTNLSNGWATSTGYTGNVSIDTKPGSYRNLATTEGSLVNTLGSGQNEPTWTNLSLGAYHGNLRNGRTGAKRLDLPLLTVGGSNLDLIRRPPVTPAGGVAEDAANPTLFGQRYFSMASLRILLSDSAASILNLPTVTATAPVALENLAVTPIAGYAVDANHPPLATSVGNPPPTQTDNTTAAALPAGTATIPVLTTAGYSPDGGSILINTTQVTYTGLDATHFTGVVGAPSIPKNASGRLTVSSFYNTPVNTGTLGGFLKIEKQDVNGVWTDVTTEILNLGIAGKNLNGACAEPNPNAILRFERVADMPAHGGACGIGSQVSTDYWPLALFDTREGNLRDNVATGTTTVYIGGVMYYVSLDVLNLRRWFQGAIAGTTGADAMNVTGYVVYFSDRRGNRDAGGNETGDYGVEDFVNPDDVSGAPNNVLDVGEDVNGDGVQEIYGETPIVVANSTAPLNAGALPWTPVSIRNAQANRAIFFRRALKVINGSLGNIIAPGLTIASENPVYLQGDWNASTGAGFGNPHVATAFITDALTLLSNAWSDRSSFTSPENPAGRPAATTWYRFAVIAGKGQSFPRPTAWASYQDFGTDGGAHNFLRYLENWGGQTLNYRGSIASFYYSRQATGTYKCCNNVYSPPTRGYNFDVDFLQPLLLPPRTPMFRDINTTGFTQITAAGR